MRLVWHSAIWVNWKELERGIRLVWLGLGCFGLVFGRSFGLFLCCWEFVCNGLEGFVLAIVCFMLVCSAV